MKKHLLSLTFRLNHNLRDKYYTKRDTCSYLYFIVSMHYMKGQVNETVLYLLVCVLVCLNLLKRISCSYNRRNKHIYKYVLQQKSGTYLVENTSTGHCRQEN